MSDKIFLDKMTKHEDSFETTKIILKLTETSFNSEISKNHFEHFLCKICQGPPVQPETCLKCQKIFCNSCITSKLNSDGRCPSCAETYTKYPLHYTIRELLQKGKFECNYKSKGCPQETCYENLNEHIKNCEYRSVLCEFCNEGILKKEEKDHIDKCSLTEVVCEKCNFRNNKKIFQSHLDFCEYFTYILSLNNSEKIIRLEKNVDQQIHNLDMEWDDKIKLITNNLSHIDDEIIAILTKYDSLLERLQTLNENKLTEFKNSTLCILEENWKNFKSESGYELKKISDQFIIEIERIDNEIVIRNEEISKYSKDIENLKKLMAEKISLLKEENKIDMIEYSKQFTQEINKSEEEIIIRHKEIISLKNDLNFLSEKLDMTTLFDKEEFRKHLESSKLQFVYLEDQIKNINEKLKSEINNNKIIQLNTEENIKDQLDKHQSEILKGMNEEKGEIVTLKENLNKIFDIVNNHKVDIYRNKIFIEDKLQTVKIDCDNEVKKFTDNSTIEVNSIKSENLRRDNDVSAIRIQIDAICGKIEVMDNEYSITFRKLLDSLQSEISALNRDLNLKFELMAKNNKDFNEFNELLEKKILNLRDENFELRKALSTLKIEILKLEEDIRKYENSVVEKYNNPLLTTNVSIEKIERYKGEYNPKYVSNADNLKQNSGQMPMFIKDEPNVSFLNSETSILDNQVEINYKAQNLEQPPIVIGQIKDEFQNLNKFIGKLDNEYSLLTHDNIFSVGFLTKNEYIITGHQDGSIVLWSLKNLSQIKKFNEHKNYVDDIQTINDQFFVSCSKDSSIKLWDIEKQVSVRTFVNDSWTFCVVHLLHYNDSLIATGDDKKNIKIWNLTTGKKMKTIFTDHSHGVGRLLHLNKISPFNLLLSSSKPEIKLWDLNSEKCVRVFKEHNGWVNALAYLKEDLFCSGSSDCFIKIWSLNSEKSKRTISAHKSYVESILNFSEILDFNGDFIPFSREERDCWKNYIVTGSLGGTMKVIDTNSDKIQKVFNRQESIFKIIWAFSKNTGKPLVLGCYWGSKILRIWGDFKSSFKINPQ